MANQQHPITLPPELVEQWRKEPEYIDCNRLVTMVTMTTDRLMQLCEKSAQYGAAIAAEFRAMCAELVDAWDATADFDFNDFGHAAADIVDRARALLAQPEPEEVPMPLPGDAEGLAEVFWAERKPQPPADGEVGELVRWLLAHADEHTEESDGPYTRAAKFLQRFASPACLVISPSPEALASLKAAGPGIIEAMPANSLPIPEVTNG